MNPLAYILAAIVGWILGVLANRFVYDWAWFAEYSLSPIGRKPAIYEKRWSHFVPVLAWFTLGNLKGKTLYPRELELASEEEKNLIPMLGRFSGFRPLLVELTCITGVPLLLAWYFSGGLTGGIQGLQLIENHQQVTWIQLILHVFNLWLMLIAAAIDWEEKTIPDQVTVTGMVIGILALTVFPAVRLPELEFSGIGISGISQVQLLSPDAYPEWGHHLASLLTGLLAWTFWAALVVPKTVDWRYGMVRGIRIMFVSILRPARKTNGLANARRSRPKAAWVTGVVWLFGLGLTTWAWSCQGVTWESHFSQLASLALAGLGTWLIRILASMTVGDEALGFGDVTLMFMIGAVFGWQFALLTFVLGPLLALGYAVVNLIVTGQQKLAFGPWLCAAAAICLIGWSEVWNNFAANGIFKIGAVTILAIVAFCLALLPPLLWVLLRLKQLAGLAD